MKTFDCEFHAGDMIRIQLDPDGIQFRYDFYNGLWEDRGYSDNWVDALITTIYPGGLVCMEYINLDGETCNFNFPTPGHGDYQDGLSSLSGWPQPPKKRKNVPICDCGCEKAKDGGTHYSWCSKQQYLNKNKKIF